MIELDLEKVMMALLYHLKVLAAVRCMCKEHGLPVDWCRKWEDEVADVAGRVRRVIEIKGNILVVKAKR